MIKIIIFSGIFISLFSCKGSSVNDDKPKDHFIINSFIKNYTQEINRNVYLNPYKIERDSYIIRKNIFNDDGFIHEEVCHRNLNVTKRDFAVSAKEKKTDIWDYNIIKNKRLITEIILGEKAKKEYESSNIKNKLKNNHEIYTYKYTLWNNPDNTPSIRLSDPFISEDKKYALIYMSKHNDGTFIWVLEHSNKNNWSIICKKRLSYY